MVRKVDVVPNKDVIASEKVIVAVHLRHPNYISGHNLFRLGSNFICALRILDKGAYTYVQALYPSFQWVVDDSSCKGSVGFMKEALMNELVVSWINNLCTILAAFKIQFAANLQVGCETCRLHSFSEIDACPDAGATRLPYLELASSDTDVPIIVGCILRMAASNTEGNRE
jgi:hypothetical protein